ncbi:MAG: hypothetical protein ACR2HV_04200, partial [Acidimicrobiales bacterium]
MADMSDRGLVEPSAGSPVPARAPAAIIEQLGSLGERSPVAQAFARAVLRWVPVSLLEDSDPVATAAALADAFAFVDH